MRAEKILEKLSFAFAVVSISAYYSLIFMGIWGLVIALINQIFWIIYFTKKDCTAQVLVNVGYMSATILGIISILTKIE